MITYAEMDRIRKLARPLYLEIRSLGLDVFLEEDLLDKKGEEAKSGQFFEFFEELKEAEGSGAKRLGGCRWSKSWARKACGRSTKTTTNNRKEKKVFEHLRNKAETVQAAYEAGHGQLYRADGSQLYSDDEHLARERALQQERTCALDGVIEDLRKETAGAQEEISVLEDGDPASLLSSDELPAAAARKVFADDEVRGMSQDELLSKLRAVLAGRDRSSVFSYWRAGSARQTTLRFESEGAGRSPVVAEIATRDLAGVLEEMRGFLAGPERLKRAENARRKISAATSLELDLSNQKQGARTASEAHKNRELASWGLSPRWTGH